MKMPAFEFRSIYFDQPPRMRRALDIFVPETVTQDVALFFIHGGAWTLGGREDFHRIMFACRGQGYICATVDYTLLGKGTATDAFAQLAEVRCGYALFLEELRKMGRPLRVVTHGASAGAHLAALMSYTQPGGCGEAVDEAVASAKWIQPVGTALQSSPMLYEPWEGIDGELWDSMRAAAGGLPYEGSEERYRRLAIRSYLSPDCCPTFFMAAGDEKLFPNEITRQGCDELRRLGVPVLWKTYAGRGHGFFYDVADAGQRQALQDLLDFARSL